MGALYRLLSENSHPRPDGHHSAYCHFVHLCTHYRGHYGAGAVRKREGFKADCAFLHLDLPRHTAACAVVCCVLRPFPHRHFARSVGLTYLQTIFRIVLPQAMRTAFPPLSNSLISMVKDTSLAANITVTEMFMVTQRIVARTYEPLLLYLEVGLIYLIFSTVLTWVQRFGEKKLASYGHKEG